VELFAFDQEYVARLRAGDPATEAHFVSYFGQLLRILLRARMLPPDRVEDVTQETFRRVLVKVRSPDGIRQPDRFGAFVNSTCKNALHESDRAGRRTDPIEDSHYEVPDALPDPHALLAAAQSRKHVRQVLSGMPKKDRDLLRELFFLEKEKDEICRERGVDREYLRVLLHRAKSRFRTEFTALAVPNRPQSVGKQKA
jgi:RNA polymerase sigma-70 factor (ECF subfamily)